MHSNRPLLLLWLLLLSLLPLHTVHTELQYNPPPPAKQKRTALKKQRRLKRLKQHPPRPATTVSSNYDLSPLLFIVLLSTAGIGLVLLLSGLFAGLPWLWMIGGILTSLGGLSFLAILLTTWVQQRPSANVRALKREMRRQERAEERAWRKEKGFYKKAVGRFFKTAGIIVGVLGLIVLPFFIGFFWFGIVLIGLVLALLLGVLIYVFIMGGGALEILATVGGMLLTLGIGGLIYGLILSLTWMWILGSVLIAIPLLGIAAVAYILNY